MNSDRGSIAIFAKCPIAGRSKTRLSNLLGDEGAANLARAMLSDILTTISLNSHSLHFDKFLVYAPGTKAGEMVMKSILTELGLYPCSTVRGDDYVHKLEKSRENYRDDLKWILIPMVSYTIQATPFQTNEQTGGINCPTAINKGAAEKTNQKSITDDSSNYQKFVDLQSTDLGAKLAHALEQIRVFHPDQPVAFVGMDSPELPIDEIYHAVQYVSRFPDKVYMNPAQDGGYGMLCIPANAPLSIFEGVRWSSSLTAISQMKALSDNGIDTVLGSLMNDIDEVDDLIDLAKRLVAPHSKRGNLFPTSRNEECSQDRILDFRFDRLLSCSEVLLNPRISDEQLTCNASQESCPCPITFMALLKLGIVKETSSDDGYFITSTTLDK